MKYKALIFDLDGTAIPNKRGGVPSEKLVQTMKLASKTTKLSAATGRPLSFCSDIFSYLDFLSPSIFTGGAVIADPTTKATLWEKHISEKSVQQIFDIHESDNCEMYFCTDEKDDLRSPSDRENKPVRLIGFYGLTSEKVESITEKLKLISHIAFHKVHSWQKNKFDIHITNNEATKHHAFIKLISLFNISAEEVIAVGDSDNDLPLFELAGLKVAMGNGSDELKKRADVIAPPVWKDGLASVIEKYVL